MKVVNWDVLHSRFVLQIPAMAGAGPLQPGVRISIHPGLPVVVAASQGVQGLECGPVLQDVGDLHWRSQPLG